MESQRVGHDLAMEQQLGFPGGSRICLPVQETRVRTLVWKHPTCHGVIKPTRHDYRARAPSLGTTTSESSRIPTREWPSLIPAREKPGQQQRPSTVNK